MNKQQTYVLWIGLLLLFAYLFTSTGFKNAVFNRSSGIKTTAAVNPATDYLSMSTGSGLSVTTGSTGSNAKVVAV